MSLTSTASLASHSPLLLPGDKIALHKNIMLTPEGIIDRPLRTTHRIHFRARPLLVGLQQYTAVNTLPTFMADDRVVLFGFLNTIGALRVQRSSSLQYAVTFLRHWCMGIRFSTISHRFEATVTDVFLAVSAACAPVIGAMAAVATLLWGSGLLTAQQAYGAGCYVSALLVASVTLHEITHLVFIQHYAGKAIVLQRGLRVGLVHTPLAQKHEITTAIAGPAIGALSCLISLCSMLSANHTLLAWSSAGIALTHVGALLPWYGDGQSIRKAQHKGLSHA